MTGQRRFLLLALRFLLLALLVLPAALVTGRILYEGFFPHLLWLGRPLPAFLLAAFVALPLLVWGSRSQPPRDQISGRLFSEEWQGKAAVFWPLLLNLIYLFDPAVDLVRSWFILGASLWLAAVLLARSRVAAKTWGRSGITFILVGLLPVYLLTMPGTVGRADTFEFQVTAPRLGIAHPTGYPLYLLLGKLFTLLPLQSVAWRLNLASAVYGLAAVSLLYLLGQRLLQKPVPALLGAVALGLLPTFWSQAIEAEVYTLHALLVAGALLLMVMVIDAPPASRHKWTVALAFVVGLGLTNHLTALFLLPPAALAVFLGRGKGWLNRHLLWQLPLTFALPLLLYAYLPLRWAAVVGGSMGTGRFLDWVTGGRFQGALQWAAWLHDPARYAILGRLFLNEWGGINLVLAGTGFVFVAFRRWRVALVLLVTWLGYTFYALNYYVPDLAVFLIPSHLVIALCWAGGVTAVLGALHRLWPASQQPILVAAVLLLSALPVVLPAMDRWTAVDRSHDDGRTQWGKGVLQRPLAANAAILADSIKYPPLYYLQQAEGMRPDLEIMVLPDEAAYRAELGARIAAGQTVYLARFLPHLQGVYHLRAAGPLTEVSTAPLAALPAAATPLSLDFGPVRLVGYDVAAVADVDENATAVTLYWQAPDPISEALYVYVRWAGDDFSSAPDVATGQHPANDSYPTNAWRAGEIVPDFHLLPRPLANATQTLDLQVALAPPFTPLPTLPWQTVAQVAVPPVQEIASLRPRRAQVGRFLLAGIEFPQQIRPQTPLPIHYSGYAAPNEPIQFSLSASGQRPSPDAGVLPPVLRPPLPDLTIHTAELATGLENGRYYLIAQQPHSGALCGWLAPATAGCVVGKVEISGVPLPEGATNFEDKIALLDVDIPETRLQPGGQFRVTLTWQSLAPMDEDYTVFVQILNEQGELVDQVNAQPLQGTYPTSQWQPGEQLEDPYTVQLGSDLPPGSYQLQVGWYLLATLRRLSVLNTGGVPVDDKVLLPGLVVP